MLGVSIITMIGITKKGAYFWGKKMWVHLEYLNFHLKSLKTYFLDTVPISSYLKSLTTLFVSMTYVGLWPRFLWHCDELHDN